MPRQIKISKEDQFLERIKNIYPNNYNSVIEHFRHDVPKSLRVNHLLSDNSKVIESLRLKGFEIIKSDMNEGYVCINETFDNRLSDTEEVKTMKVYIQELSSMIPVFLLSLKKNDRVLDLCAAPGSKTTLVADVLKNNGEIVANEENRDRFFKLQKIVKEYGAKVKTINENGKILPYKRKEYVQYFDKILVDVPCSNEASLQIGHYDSFKYWRSSNSSNLSKLQKGLLSAAITMLKPGGTLVYSTCTIAVEENEGVVDWALTKFPDINLSEVNTELKLKNFQLGLTKYKEKSFNESLNKTVRILPDGKFKAFYLAKFIKDLS